MRCHGLDLQPKKKSRQLVRRRPMGADDTKWKRQSERDPALHLPRYVVDHIGQVMRNRSGDILLIPLTREMKMLLEALDRSRFSDPADE
jgi:hypothetical protein